MSALFLSILMLAVADPAAPPAAGVPQTDQVAAPADPMDKMVCRRQVETGSLVRAKRQCHTRRQWAYIDQQGQAVAGSLVDDGRGRQSGN